MTNEQRPDVTLHFSGILLRLVGCERAITLPAATLGDAVAAVEARHPQLHRVLRDGDGRLRRAHRIFINGELEPAADLSTPLADEDHVEFLTAIAGS